MKKIYRVQVEVEPMEGAEMPEDNLVALVNVFVGTNKLKESLDIAEKALLIDRYYPRDIVAAFELVLEEMESEEFDEDDMLPKEELIVVRESGGVQYGAFLCFHQDDHDGEKTLQ